MKILNVITLGGSFPQSLSLGSILNSELVKPNLTVRARQVPLPR
jgi:hypothetical protein